MDFALKQKQSSQRPLRRLISRCLKLAFSAGKLLAAVFLLCFFIASPRAYAEEKKGNDRVFDLDAPPKPSIRLTNAFRVGVNLGFEAQLEDNFDLENESSDDVILLQPSLEVAVRYIPIEKLVTFVDFELAREILEEENDVEEQEFPDESDGFVREERTKLQLKHAYIHLNELVNGFDLKVGRQRLKDEREWIFDEELDGIRLYLAYSRFALDFSVSERNDTDLLHGAEEEEITNYALFFSYCPIKKNTISAYAFYRDGRSDFDEEPLFFGVSLGGKLFRRMEYWLEAAYVTGDSGTNDIRGYGFDAGSTLEFDLPLKPSITIGYAFGSGDDDPLDDTDENFRQTGLQDNNAAFNGITRFKYYGEAFDPELSNLGIATAGIGIKPSRAFSVDLVYHYYYQQELSDDIRDSDLDMDPLGDDKEIGHEVDIIVGLRTKKHFRATLAVGYFMPGKAFPDDADEAFFAEAKMQIFF